MLCVIYSALMLLTKATMLDSRYFAVTVPLINALLLPLAHGALKRLLLHFQRSWGMESLVGIVTTTDRADRLINEIGKDWSRRIVGVALLEATHEIVGTEIDGIAVKANFTDFMDWIRREALDEVYVDVPMDSGESFIPYLEEMESMGLTVHFRLPLLDRIEEACCDETSAARLSRSLGRCAGGNIVTMGTQNSPAVERIRTLPTIGPVQENDTNTSVRAMKKIPIKPPLSACRSLLLTIQLGSVISKAPEERCGENHEHDEEDQVGKPVRSQPVEDVGRHGIAAHQTRNQNDRRNGKRIERYDEETVHRSLETSRSRRSAAFHKERYSHRDHREYTRSEQRREAPKNRFDNQPPQGFGLSGSVAGNR